MSGFITQSNFGACSSGTILQTLYASLSANATTTATTWPSSGTAQDLLSVTLTTSTGTILLISFASASGNTVYNGSADRNFFRIVIDTFFPTTTPSGQGCGPGLQFSTASIDPGHIRLRSTGLAAGSHTVKVQWRVDPSVGTGQVNAGTNPDGESASLTVMEVAV